MPCTPKVITHQQCGLLINNDSVKKRYERIKHDCIIISFGENNKSVFNKSHRVMWRDDQHWRDDLNNGCVIET